MLSLAELNLVLIHWPVSLCFWSSTLMQKGTVQVQQNPQPPAKTQNSKFGGLKNTLKNLRARMRTDNRTLVRI